MNFSDLLKFVEFNMKMSHIYQPLLIKTLVESGGVATVTQIARVFSAADENQVRFYEARIKQMPLKVLKGRKIVTVDKGVVTLDITKLSFTQRTKLVAVCNQRIADFIEQRGEGVWSGMIQLDPVPATTRYMILKRDKICQLCGNTKDDAPLEVDHIVPRSKGGTNDPKNLQTLCRPCNQGKSNLDDTDFTT
jgi:ATP adenylyltransferase